MPIAQFCLPIKLPEPGKSGSQIHYYNIKILVKGSNILTAVLNLNTFAQILLLYSVWLVLNKCWRSASHLVLRSVWMLQSSRPSPGSFCNCIPFALCVADVDLLIRKFLRPGDVISARSTYCWWADTATVDWLRLPIPTDFAVLLRPGLSRPYVQTGADCVDSRR